MKPRSQITMTLPEVELPPEVAHEISWWLYGLAHEFDRRYQDEIRAHIQWEDNQRNRLNEQFDEETVD